MATVEEVARSLIAAVSSDAGHLLVAQWVADRYRQLCARTHMRHLRQVGELVIPAAITAGTVTATRGSSVVTGNATAQAAWSSAIVGRYFRADVTWYEIAGLVGGEIRLRSAYSEATASSVAYHIVERYSTLAQGARFIGQTVVHMRRRLPVERVQLEQLDVDAPDRKRVGVGAESWCEIGDRYDSDGVLCKAIETYPYATDAEMYGYIYYPVTPTLAFTDQVPPTIDVHVLREGAMADYFRWEMMRLARAGQVEPAALMRNEYRTQETAWERDIKDAIRADRGTDDLTMIFKRPNVPIMPGEIRTAYDQVLARWPR